MFSFTLVCVCVSVCDLILDLHRRFWGEFSHICTPDSVYELSQVDRVPPSIISFLHGVFLRLHLLVILLLPLSDSTCHEPQLILLYLRFSNLSVSPHPSYMIHLFDCCTLSCSSLPSILIQTRNASEGFVHLHFSWSCCPLQIPQSLHYLWT